jgi:hypothetical protein
MFDLLKSCIACLLLAGLVKDFDAPVDRFPVPVSSPAAGSELISKIQALAGVCAH